MSCDRQEKDYYVTRTTIAISTIVLPLCGSSVSMFMNRLNLNLKLNNKINL